MNINLDEISRLDKSGFKQYFFYACEKGELVQIHKMFLNIDIKSRFNSEILAIGLFAGLLADKPKVIDKILAIQDKLNVDIEEKDLVPIFNLLLKKGDDVEIDYLDSKSNFLEKQFKQEGYLSLVDNKFDHAVYCIDGYRHEPSNLDIILEEYTGNILNRSLKNENHLTYLLNKDYPINPTLVEELFLKVCVNKNMSCAKVLLSHEKTKSVILMSEQLKAYMEEPTENKEFKDDIRALINSIDLKETLSSNLIDKTAIRKVKL